MAEQYDNTNRGAIWKNERKEKDTHPDFRGELDVNGASFWISAWKRKEGASDKSPALSISIQAKDDGVKKPSTDTSLNDMGDDIPF